MELTAVNSLRIAKEKVFLGPGTRELLVHIKAYESIQQAAIKMNLSYSKALKMLKTMHSELGYDVVISQRGGKDKGKTQLTPKGEALLSTFLEIEEKVQKFAQTLVAEKFNQKF